MALRWLVRSGAVLTLVACVVGQTVAQSEDVDAEKIKLLRDIRDVQPETPRAECPRPPDTPDIGSEGSPLLFIVDKTGAPIFATADTATARDGETLRLGKLLFADKVRSDCERVRVLAMDLDTVVSRVGWMQTEDLLVERRSAVEIGQAISQGLTVERSNVNGGFHEGNALKLRFVTKPELRVKLGVRPGDDSGEALSTFRWFYVYDIEQHNGEAWGLMGEVARLFSEKGIENTDYMEAEKLLLGWGLLSQLQIWATNLAFEINTHPNAVAGRLKRVRGAQVLAERHADAKLIYDEPLAEFWPEGNANPAIKDVVDFDPYGIAPDFPRLAVVQAHPGYIAVASAGSKDDELSLSGIGRIKRDIKKVARDLQKVDIIFVLDTTGSMGPAIDKTRDFLARINNHIKKVASSGASKVIDFGNAGEIEISTNLDIAVSLIGFQDVPPAISPAYTTKEYFSLLDVGRHFSSISAAFLHATRELTGGAEALHYGVRRALERKYSREGALSRLVIVITDEPGDTDMQQQIYDQLPTYSEDLLQTRPRLRSISHDEQKKEITKIFSIYLGPEEGRRLFRQKSEIYSRELFEIIDFVDQGQTREFLDALGEALIEHKETIEQNTQAFAYILQLVKIRAWRTWGVSGADGIGGARGHGAPRTHFRRHR